MGDMQWVGIIGATIAIGSVLFTLTTSWEPRRPEDDHGRMMAKLGGVVEHAKRLGQ